MSFVDPTGLTYEVCGAEFGGSACIGEGFWGGGVNMNSHVSLHGASGRETIDLAEHDHDYRYYNELNGPFRFHSAFVAAPWGGFSPTGASGEHDGPKKTPAEKQREYQDCLKNVTGIFDQAHAAIPNVFHNSLPSLKQTAGVLFGTTVRATATGIAAGGATVSGAAPLVVSTATVAYSTTWGFNVLSNTVKNAAQRGTLLGEELKARIGCRAFLQ